jgi:alanine racemase
VKRLRPAWVDVDLDAIRHNVRVLKPDAAELMAVVKANGYGHGDVEVTRAALEAGATWIGVALVEEGIRLRAAGIEAPILLLSEPPPGAERAAIEATLTPTLYTENGIARLAGAAGRRSLSVHVKVDTGMHRVGLWPPEEAAPFVDRVVGAGLVPAGLWTHFARADDDEVTTKEQLARFHEVVDDVRRRGHRPRFIHAANSAAAILYPDTHFDLVRIGLALYGIEPRPGVGSHLSLRAALTWRSVATMVKRLPAGEPVSYGHRYRVPRPTSIATVPVGYADGYPRLLSSRADALIGGHRVRVAGAVTMDQVLLDCGDHPVEVGEEVVLLGTQGSETVTAEELARHAETIPYEIVSRVGERVPREHRG